MTEVVGMFDDNSVLYTAGQWDGNWTPDELSAAAEDLFAAGTDKYFISWTTGTIEPKSGSMGGFGGSDSLEGFGGPGNSENGFKGPNGADGPKDGFGGRGGNGGMGGGMSGGMGSSAYHMASFDYAYNCIAVMEWLFGRTN